MTALLVIAACSGTDGVRVPDGSIAEPTGDTGTRGALTAELGPVLVLTDPPDNGMHHHATVAWGGDRFALAFVVNGEPDTQAWVQVHDADGRPQGDAVHLNDGTTPRGDKPDIEWDGARWVLAWDDAQGGVWLGALGEGPLAPAQLHQTDLETEAVDLAVRPDGSGVAIWTEAGAPDMDPEDGRIVWRAFDAALAPVAETTIAEESSKKASDASPRADGGWIGVWAIHYPHPTIPDEYAYEVHAELFPPSGAPVGFRADDAVDTWPSRPAVAVGPGDAFAVSWRDKTASRGDSDGAWGRLFAADATPLGPAIALDPGGDGDRVVVAWAGDLVVFAWQETLEGVHGVELSVADRDGHVLVDRLELSEPGGDPDERPSITVRDVDGGHQVLAVWETPAGLRGRAVTLVPAAR